MKNFKRNLKFSLITVAFATLIIIAFCKVFSMSSVSDKDFRTYKNGVEFFQKKDYENAYFNFSNVSRNSKLYEIALLREANCADELKDIETAVKKYHLFIERFPDSMFAPKAYYSLGQNYYRKNEHRKAEKIFNTLKKNSRDEEYAIAANYYLGLINKKKNPQKAKTFFVAYMKGAPKGRFSLNCINEIIALDTDLSTYENKIIGQTYFLNSYYKNALPYLNKADMRTNWHYLFKIYQHGGDTQKANEIFENGYKNYSAGIDEKELLETLEYYALTRGTDEKTGWYKLLELAKQNHSKGEDFIMYRLSKLVEAPLKEFFYKEIVKKCPEGNFASDALSNLFWLEFQNRNYIEAASVGRIHIKNYPDTIAAPRIHFWMGRIAEIQGRKNEAKGFYHRILEKYPDNYYAYRANKKLSLISGSSPWKTRSYRHLPSHTGNIPFPLNHTTLSDENIALINLILKLDDYELLNEVEKENKFVQSWLNYKEGRYSHSAILARDALAQMPQKPEFSDSVYKLAYQLHYQDAINKYAEKFNLDSYLVTALIREESYFNPSAKSSVGALGLMQIMPSTASYIASKENVPYYDTEALLTPEPNLNLGCAYLRYTKNQLNDNDLLAVASYNGGPNAVKNWTNKLNYNNLDEFIENIPYDETRNYVKKVYRTYWVYLNMY